MIYRTGQKMISVFSRELSPLASLHKKCYMRGEHDSDELPVLYVSHFSTLGFEPFLMTNCGENMKNDKMRVLFKSDDVK